MNGKLRMAATGMLLSTGLLAGTYDGVWLDASRGDSGSDADYWVLYQNADQLLMVSNWSQMDGWEAFLGPLTGSGATLETLMAPDDTRVRFSLDFSSPTTGTFTLHSCTGSACVDAPPAGQAFPMVKIF